MNNNMQPIIKTTTKIPFFRRAVLQNFPFIEKDFDALTDYELLCKVVEYLNKVIVQTNLMEDNENELVRVYNELYNYVEHYFDNLDVQEEINNKLDAMVEAGTLQEIIAEYLNSKAVFGFDNVDSMKNATNLINGSYAKTLGYYEANDGGSGLYKIRTITNEDTVDNGSIIPLNDNTLVAELIIIDNEVNVKQFGARGDNSTNDTIAIQNAINVQNKKSVFIPSGTFLISSLLINETINLKGVSTDKTLLKSISNNNNDALINIYNNGLIRTEISNLWINGNSNNNTNIINGIKLYCDDINSDKFTNIHDLRITSCTGNGIYIEKNLTTNDIREIRLINIDIGTCNGNGILADSCTDSYFDKITSHSNNKNGFVFKNGNNKINNCKAFWNGQGFSGEYEEEKRLPVSAFTPTSDTSYVSGKQYYLKNGNNTQNKWFYFTKFTGSVFEQGTTYYELTTQYQKRYAGFLIEGLRNIITGCESQDNFGDGFYITGSFNVISGILVDNNGLITNNGSPVSYSSQGLEQLYYGIYAKDFNSLNVVGNFTNYRYNEIGYCQKAPIFVTNCSNVTLQILSNNQVNNFVMCLLANINTIVGKCNNKEFRYDYDINDITLNDSSLSIYNDDADNKSYLYKENNIVYYKFIIKDSNGILPNTNDRAFLTLPQNFRPSNILFKQAYLTNSNGYTMTTNCVQIIYKSGSVRARNTNSGHTSDVGIVLEGSFPVDN